MQQCQSTGAMIGKLITVQNVQNLARFLEIFGRYFTRFARHDYRTNNLQKVGKRFLEIFGLYFHEICTPQDYGTFRYETDGM